MFRKILLSLVTLILVYGCAVGVKHDYVQDGLVLDVSTDRMVVVATLDHRSYVLNSRKNANFVGLSRGGFGNPFDVVTQSGNPLAEDISQSIVLSLKKSGVDAQAVSLESSQSVTDARKKLAAVGAHRTLLFTLREWKGDAMMNVGFAYDFDFNLIDENNNLLLEKQVSGDENLGAADAFTPGGGKQVTARFKSLIEGLFQDPEVKRYLN